MSLLIVLFAALMIPLAMARFKITAVPTAIAEIIVGIIIGRTGFQFVETTNNLSFLSSLGVIILIFLSGMEIDFSLFKSKSSEEKGTQPLPMAILSFVAILGTSVLLAFVVKFLGIFDNLMLSTILFSTIALGVVIAALKEKELLSKPYGQRLLLIAVLGEIIPLLALSAYAALNGGQSEQIWLILVIFLVAILLLWRFRGIYDFFAKVDKSTTQLDIRLAFFIVFTLVTVAETVGAENILGAFLAGIVMKLLQPSESTQEKLTSVGYGFFIPVFFIMTGAKLELRSLLIQPEAWLMILLLFVCFMVAKAGLFFTMQKSFNRTNALAGACISATTITLVLPTLEVAAHLDQITEVQVGEFTLAAVLCCILAPIFFNKFYQSTEEEEQLTKVTFFGTNVLTIPVAQQLAKGWYDIQMVTDDREHYETFRSAMDHVLFLENREEQTLFDKQIFDADVLVLGYRDDAINYEMAQLAAKYEVPRVIVRLESHDLTDTKYEQLQAKGAELFNTFDVNISLLREMIDSPSTLKMLTDTESGLYEVSVNNRRYTGIPIKSLPFIEAITISRIYRNNEFIAPRGNTVIELGDHLIFTGNKETVKELRHVLSLTN